MLAVSVKPKPKIIKADLFAPKPWGSVIVIPVNAYVKNDGRAVMAKGCAGVARKKFKDIDANWGSALLSQGRLKGNAGLLKTEAVGNHVTLIYDEPKIVAFPTQYHFTDVCLGGRWFSKKADLGLIDRSACELAVMADYYAWHSIFLVAVGCGQGQRDFETEVRPILNEYLDDRFTICIP